MRIFEANISPQVVVELRLLLNEHTDFLNCNEKIQEQFGLVEFFPNREDYEQIRDELETVLNIVEEIDRTEYGDFQTNLPLASKIIERFLDIKESPTVVVEPTCGKGNFVIACLTHLDSIEYFYGVEIYKPYVWETKFAVLDIMIANPDKKRPLVQISHADVFDYAFEVIAQKHKNDCVWVVGNPPWVTNSKLGALNSTNLPVKRNFKNMTGLDAMTGKGNFDIGEYITLKMIRLFQKHNGNLFFLVKNTVIKNIVFEQKACIYSIDNVQQFSIDSKMEFGAAVEASLLVCNFKGQVGQTCVRTDFYKLDAPIISYGWVDDKFVSNIHAYQSYGALIDGDSIMEWRQGLKHDCAAIMELDRENGHYINGNDDKINLENDLVFGMIKSSDLKVPVVDNPRKHTIVTQKLVGQETHYIKSGFPKTFAYLDSNSAYFEARKSSIYINKPRFSIFGIGDYSFKPYKVAISGLYKTYHFTLVLPFNDKPLMLDDTCYFIGFDRIDYAVFAYALLNSEVNKGFLKAITFPDAKRVFTKDVLMRIDLAKIAEQIEYSEIVRIISTIKAEKPSLDVNINEWNDFLAFIEPASKKQMTLFN